METFTPPELKRFVDELERRFQVDENEVLEKLSARRRSISAPAPQPGRSVRLWPVSTFILGAKEGRLGYVVSSVAKHWGVIVGDEEKFLYHLVFEDQADAFCDVNPDSLTGRKRAVKFNALLWDPPKDLSSSTKRVGDTRFSTDELVKLGRVPMAGGLIVGKDMIAAFGDYHRVFWNCQSFARCFLKVICEEAVSFDAWAVSDAANLVCLPRSVAIQNVEVVPRILILSSYVLSLSLPLWQLLLNENKVVAWKNFCIKGRVNLIRKH